MFTGAAPSVREGPLLAEEVRVKGYGTHASNRRTKTKTAGA
jgi:hypothetical protein